MQSRLGTPETLVLLIDFAQRDDIALKLKVEAIDALSHWAEPSLLDRVDGRYRGKQKRDLELLKRYLRPMMSLLDIEKKMEVKVELIRMFAEVGEQSASQKIFELFRTDNDAMVRATALRALGRLNYQNLNQLVMQGMTDKSSLVRAEAIGLLTQVILDKDRFKDTMESVLAEGSIEEQQKLLKVLGKLDTLVTQSLIEGLIAKMANNNLDPSLYLDLTEAVAKTQSVYLNTQLTTLTTDKLSGYNELMYGGSIENGRDYFYDGSAGQCVRCHGLEKGSVGVGPNLSEMGTFTT